MSLNWTWFFLGAFTALCTHLLTGFRALSRLVQLRSRNARWLRALPLFLQLVITGLIGGSVGALGFVAFYLVLNRPIGFDPLLWSLGWLLGTLVAGLIRRPQTPLPTDQE